MFYILENKIVIEEFERNRTQDIINFKELISVFDVSNTGLEIIVGAASQNEQIGFAPIYLMNVETNMLKRRLDFHTRGVQYLKYNENSEYFVSLGNCKENKVAVWSSKEQCLIASTGLAVNENCHEVKWKPFLNEQQNQSTLKQSKYKANMEFAVVGKNKITIFGFDPMNESLYTKTQKMLAHGFDDIELTSVEYALNFRYNWTLLVGSENGHFYILDAETLDLRHEMTMFNSEISTINYSLTEDKVSISSLTGEVRYWNYNSIDLNDQEFLNETHSIKLPAGVTALSLNVEANEGFASTLDGGVYWVDLLNRKFTPFLRGVDNFNKVIRTLQINDDMIITIHSQGDVKIWNTQTAEILKEFKWKYQITGAVFVEKRNQIVLFLANYNFITVSLDNFDKINYYRIDNVNKIQIGYMLNYITKAIVMEMGETPKYLMLTERGDTLVADFTGDSIIDVRKIKFWKLNSNISDIDFLPCDFQ